MKIISWLGVTTAWGPVLKGCSIRKVENQWARRDLRLLTSFCSIPPPIQWENNSICLESYEECVCPVCVCVCVCPRRRDSLSHRTASKPPDSIGSRSSHLTLMGSKCRQMVEPVEGHQTHNLVVAAEITRQVGIQTMSATDFLILPSPQPWPRAMLQGAHWGRRDSGTCLVTLGYVEHPQCKFLSPGPALCIHSC